MLATPSIALDFPLKILVWEDGQGRVWLSYNSPEYLKKRHGLPEGFVQYRGCQIIGHRRCRVRPGPFGRTNSLVRMRSSTPVYSSGMAMGAHVFAQFAD